MQESSRRFSGPVVGTPPPRSSLLPPYQKTSNSVDPQKWSWEPLIQYKPKANGEIADDKASMTWSPASSRSPTATLSVASLFYSEWEMGNGVRYLTPLSENQGYTHNLRSSSECFLSQYVNDTGDCKVKWGNKCNQIKYLFGNRTNVI